jgi:hypothetical protein
MKRKFTEQQLELIEYVAAKRDGAYGYLRDKAEAGTLSLEEILLLRWLIEHELKMIVN